MKRILLTLLLCPVIAQAQFLECNVGAGPTVHNIRTGYLGPGIPKVGYNISFSATTKVKYGIRVGLSASYVRMPHRMGVWGTVPSSDQLYTDPVLLEFMAVSRNKIGRCDLDLGVMGGVCVNRRLTTVSIDDNYPSKSTYYRNPWCTYGLIGSLQYNVSSHFALGVQIHPAFLDMINMRDDFFTIPIAVRGSFKI